MKSLKNFKKVKLNSKKTKKVKKVKNVKKGKQTMKGGGGKGAIFGPRSPVYSLSKQITFTPYKL